MANQTNQFDFLHSFIQQMLDAAGFEGLTEKTRGEFVPMFCAEAERRLGLALMPLLNEEQAKELLKLAESDGVDEKKLADFWTKSVPNFADVVESTLRNFAEEFKNTLAKVSR